MPQYAYAIVIVDGKRKVIKTKGFSDANPLLANGRVMLAKSELEKDLKAAGIKYTYIGISEHPPTAADLEKTAKEIKSNTSVTKKPTTKNTKTKVTPAQLTKILRETFDSEGVPCKTVKADFSGNPNDPTSVGFDYKPNSLDFISYSFINLRFSPLLESAPVPVLKDFAKMIAAKLMRLPANRTPLFQSWLDANKHRWENTNISSPPKTKKKNNSADTSMKDVKGMYSFKAALGNHTRGPFEMTLKEAIKYASKWSGDSDWDYEYGVDFISINVYRDGKPIGHIDSRDGEWHSGRTVKED